MESFADPGPWDINYEADDICMPVVHRTQTDPYHQPNIQLIIYDIDLRNMMPGMDIEQYINEVVNTQKSRMEQNAPPPVHSRPAFVQSRMQENAPRPALVPLQMPISRKSVVKHVINVEVVPMETDKKEKNQPVTVEPLPPVEASLKGQVERISKSQDEYTEMLSQVTAMLKTLNRRFEGKEEEPRPRPQAQARRRANPQPRQEPEEPLMKRPRLVEAFDSGKVYDHPYDVSYPVRLTAADGSYSYVLGPNNTTLSSKQFATVFWTTASVATRTLLLSIFDGDHLATHTLTGKPSPAFYGRERPRKKMLDPLIVEDIIASVSCRTGGRDRHIRATITTKCADAAKKLKRRAKKAAADLEAAQAKVLEAQAAGEAQPGLEGQAPEAQPALEAQATANQ